MNTPGTVDGNWSWRMEAEDFDGPWRTRWRTDLVRYGRLRINV